MVGWKALPLASHYPLSFPLAPLLFSSSLRRAAAAGRGPGGGVSPEGQVASMPIDVRGNFKPVLRGRLPLASAPPLPGLGPIPRAEGQGGGERTTGFAGGATPSSLSRGEGEGSLQASLLAGKPVPQFWL
jgi:hypothetical protein